MKEIKGKQQALLMGQATITENAISVIASSVGNMDRGGCVICPGAYPKGVLRDFVENGSILVGHDWDALPIGVPTGAEMKGDELICSAEFHSTQAGQDARTVCVERMASGKSVSVSVGFMPDYKSEDGIKYFESGKDMLDWLEAAGHDLAAYDAKAIRARKGWCYAITRILELFEWSIVMVGMNPRAKAREVKDFDGDDGSRDVPLAVHLDQALGVCSGLVNRLEGLADLRASEGSRISAERLPAMKELKDRLGEVIAMSEAPDTADEREDSAALVKELQFRTLAHRTG